MKMSDEERRAKARAKYAENPEKHRARAKAWYAANPERARENNTAWCAANLEKKRESNTAWRAANPEKHRACSLVWSREHPEDVIRQTSKAREDLAPSYVAFVLQMSVKDVTPELLELKREQLRLTRIARELKKELKNV